MPFVRIEALRADQAKLNGLGRAVHEALIDAIGIPADDLFQVLTSHDGTTSTFRYDPDYLGVHRDDGIVYVDITMRAGRTDEQKKALYARLAELAGKYDGPGTPSGRRPASVRLGADEPRTDDRLRDHEGFYPGEGF
jgi:phenylpyruvate tautomerase PptA (4-oxalocrotonate tautomerase family)